MEKELVRKECSWCKKEFLGHTYQEFCTHFCSDKSYYWHRKRGLKREKAKIICDICGIPFKPKRVNVKRCSDLCRKRWEREWASERYERIKKKQLENVEPRKCIVCNKQHFLGEKRITCSSECAREYQTYSCRRRKWHREYGRAYVPETMPMPEHDAIPVGKVDLSSSEDIEKAINSFILQGGKIRKCKDMVAVNFIDDTNPLTMNNISESELQDEVHGTVRAE